MWYRAYLKEFCSSQQLNHGSYFHKCLFLLGSSCQMFMQTIRLHFKNIAVCWMFFSKCIYQNTTPIKTFDFVFWLSPFNKYLHKFVWGNFNRGRPILNMLYFFLISNAHISFWYQLNFVLSLVYWSMGVCFFLSAKTILPFLSRIACNQFYDKWQEVSFKWHPSEHWPYALHFLLRNYSEDLIYHLVDSSQRLA